MANLKERPLSPHLSVWKPRVWMAVSITHRVTGVGLSLIGVCVLVWWLAALASGPGDYATFMDTFTVTGGGLNIIGYGLFIGLTWAFFQHMGSGIRHLLMDMGAGYELRTSARSAWAAYVFAPIATVFVWAYIVLR